MARRLALLIATYAHDDAGLRRLTAPAHDAETLAAVLKDPRIAGFEVTTLINEPHHRVGAAIGDFYRDRRRDDLTLLYFTGHGLKDDDGRLYLAMTNTRRDSLLFTALPADHIDQAMTGCASLQKVLILDCCYSGAFPAGRLAKADPEVHTLERFHGRGRTVLTASDSTQYSFEGDRLQGEAVQSVFTRYLVAGLRDGSADLDGDGDITLDELYSYVHDRVVEDMPQQRPKKQANVEGRIIIARNINWVMPRYLVNALGSPIATDRLTALDSLRHLHQIGNETVREHVVAEIRKLAGDDSRAVSAAATQWLQRQESPAGASIAETPEHPRAPAGAGKPDQTEDQPRTAPPGPAPATVKPAEVRPAGRPPAEPSAGSIRTSGQPPPHPPGPRLMTVLRQRKALLVPLATVVLIAVAATLLLTLNKDSSQGGSQGPPPLRGLAASADGLVLFVATARGLSVVDLVDRTATESVGLGGSAGPFGVAVGGDRVYFTGGSTSSDVIVLNSATDPAGNGGAGRNVIQLKDKMAVIDNPLSTNHTIGDAAATPDNRLYVSHTNPDGLSVIDVPSNKIVAGPIALPKPPTGIAISPNGRFVYVASYDDDTISAVETATNQVLSRSYKIESPLDVAISGDGKHLFVSIATTEKVEVIDTVTGDVVNTINVDGNPGSLAISPDGKQLYVAALDATTVTTFDAATYAMQGTPLRIP
jgi:YVTN family beta-propeller protein